MSRAGVGPVYACHMVVRRCEMRYAGYTHAIAVSLPSGHLERDRAAVLPVAFEAAYNALYTEVQAGRPVETSYWRLTISGPHPQVHLEVAMTQGANGQPKGECQVYVPVDDFCSTPVYDR